MKSGGIVLQLSMHQLTRSQIFNLVIAAMTPFHTEKCCHPVIVLGTFVLVVQLTLEVVMIVFLGENQF